LGSHVDIKVRVWRDERIHPTRVAV
jgi:hypothetical protein